MDRQRHLADAINLRIACPHCGKQIRQALSWFEGKDSVPCGSCGHMIDLRVEPYRSRIEACSRRAARAQAALRRAGGG
jgi:transcription elongation factor Elf1